MRVLIVGCGYLGKLLGSTWVREGLDVWGLRRNSLALKSLEMIGIHPVKADLLKSDTLSTLPAVDWVVLCQAPEKNDDYRRTYFEGTSNLLSAFRTKKPKKIILISSTSVYGVQDGAWVDESTNLREENYNTDEEAKKARALLDTEELVRSSTIPAVVVRFGGLYGPKRNRIQGLREGKTRPDFSEVYSNRIHVEDAVSVVKLLLEKGKPGNIYLGVDEHPSTQREFYQWLCERLGLSKDPGPGPSARPASRTGNKRCSNIKLKALGMRFKYPSFVEGYEALMAEMSRR